jgi:DNA polymerase III epsilon subunit-like protein
MAHTYEELRKKTIADLREIAKGIEHEAVQGYTQMNKDHLLPALCKALGIDAHEHHAAALAEKAVVKAKLREIKAKRTAALEKGDRALVAQLRQQHRRLNHMLRTSAKRAMLH